MLLRKTESDKVTNRQHSLMGGGTFSKGPRKVGVGDFHHLRWGLTEVVGVIFPRWGLTSFHLYVSHVGP